MSNSMMPRLCTKCPCHYVPGLSPLDFCDVCADDDGQHWVASQRYHVTSGSVEVKVSESEINAWWLQLDLNTKLKVFAENLGFSLTGLGSDR